MDESLMRELFYVTIASVFLLTYMILVFKQKMKREDNRFKSYSLNATTPIDGTIVDTLNSMCEECFEDYLVLNPDSIDVSYIDEETERNIQREVLIMFRERISPAFIDKLSLYYNPNNLNDIITRKMVIIITGYVVNTNQIKPEPVSNKK